MVCIKGWKDQLASLLFCTILWYAIMQRRKSGEIGTMEYALTGKRGSHLPIPLLRTAEAADMENIIGFPEDDKKLKCV